MTPRGNTGVIGTTDATFTSGSVVFSGSFTSIDVKTDAQKDVVRNGVGDTIWKGYYDITERKGTFEFVTLQSPFTPPAVGFLGALTSTLNPQWAGNWIVEDHSVKASNGKSQTCTLDLSYNANVQS
jgi:hypothetical protein